MAYAAVISLKHTIQRLKNPIKIPQITKSAYEELDSLVSMLKSLDDRSCRSIDRSVINDLDAKIRDAAWKLEDVLDSSLIPPSQGLDDDGIEIEIEIEIDSFLKTVKKLREEYTRELKYPSPREEDDAAVSPVHNSTTVGLSDLSEKIMNNLLHGMSEGKVVSLLGMAGIGKTHLATQICQHPLIVQHFDSILWVRVGPRDEITKNIYVDIVAQLKRKPRDLYNKKNIFTLKDLLQRSLSGRRYLIVLDDIWSTQVVDFFTNLFPESRSLFLLTTRLQEVAKYFQKAKIYQIPFLNKEESWNLLQWNVFAENYFPSYELEKAGRKIAEKCEGLPLLIIVVANILRGLDKTEEYWNKVAEKKTATFTDAYDQIYEVLLSSYEYLPQHLKPCFLYMGVFPQSREIPVSMLTNFWTVEDFLEPTVFQFLDDFAMECIRDLVSNSLAIVCKRRAYKITTSKLHSVYWYLSVKEARKNMFFHVLNKLTDVSIERPRRLSVQNNVLFGIKEVYHSMAATTTTTRSLLCTGEAHQYPVPICFNMMLVMKVMDALAIRFYEFPNEVAKLLQLRYLSLTHNGEVPSSISNLQQLEWLILRRHHNIKLLPTDSTTCLPEEIWDLEQLRYLRIMGSKLPDPSKGTKLWKLITLYVNAYSCTEDVFRSIPNLKKLGIKIELEPDDDGGETLRCLEHIGVLKELRSLKCVVVNPHQLRFQEYYINSQFLHSLSLKGLRYTGDLMHVISFLSFLRVLKLRCSTFPWSYFSFSPFDSLEFLLLEDIDLVDMETRHYGNHKSLKNLCHLIVRHCYKLKRIPLEIGDCKYLETLEVDDCSPSVVASALQIKEKTKSSHLQLVISSSWNL